MDPISSSIITTSYVVEFSQEDVGDDRIRLDLSLIGRIFWPVEPKPSLSVLHALARRWHIRPEDLQIFDVGHGLTQFVFPNLKDKERVFQTQPWAFKSSIINLMVWETLSQVVFDKLQFMPLVIQLKEILYPYSTAKFCAKLVEPLDTVISADLFSKYPNGHGTRFVKCTVQSTFFRALLGESRLWFQISNLSGFCLDMKTFLLFVLFMVCLATVTNTATMLMCFLLTEKNKETGCWLDHKATKSKLPIYRRLPHPNRSGNPRCPFLPFSILMSMFLRVHPQVQCRLRIHPLLLRLCSHSLRFLFVMVVLITYLLAFLFDVPSPLTCLPFLSSIEFPSLAVIFLTLS
ncbi:hypothetical protein LINGRAHAP2_LOCUS10752 [Linum grandiflorum]